MSGRLISFAVAVALVAAPPAAAAPGQVDRSFGAGGIATAELGPHYEETSFEGINALGDGAVLATREHLVRRFLANGSLDTGFAPQPAPDKPTESRVQLPSGKTLVTSQEVFTYGTKTAITEIGVRRLNADGSPDLSYGGGDGLVRLHADFGFSDFVAKGIVATAGEGAVVIAGATLIGLSPDGSLDKGYGADGSIKVSGNVMAFDQLADGRLEIAGYAACCETPSDLFVNRYTAGGAPDQGYGNGGRATADFGASEYGAGALWSDDGSVLLGGVRMEADGPSPTPFCVGDPVCTETPVVARFDGNGHLDPGFGQGGLLRLDSLSGSSKERLSSLGLERLGVAALSARPGGGYFASGSGGPGETFAFIAALTPSGGLDQSFGGGIVTERSPEPSSQRAKALAVGRDGSVYLGGSTDAGVGEGPGVVRFRPDGALDSGYGEGGFGGLAEGAGVSAMALDSRGRATLLTGQRQVSRLTADGDIDRSFGVEGRVAPTPGALYALTALPGGGLVGAGSWTPRRQPRNRMVAVRLRPDGSPDKRFGHDGHAGIACPREACVAYRVGVDRRGRIVLAGVSDNRMAIARLLPDGSRDRGFGGDGLVFPPVGTGSLATALTLRPDGIYVAGLGHRPDQNEQVLINYRDDGRLDRGFGRGGVIHIPTNRRVNPVAILPTRSRVLMVTAADRRSVFAYTRDGRPDRSFGRGAKLAPRRSGSTLAALQRGKLVLGWTRPLANELEQVALQRLRSR
jgi:uncharacterized delta-60 repeat protein